MRETVLLTGASKGIGRELAYVFARKGFDIVLVARSTDLLQEVKNEIEQKYNVTGTVITADLINEIAAEELFGQLEQQNIQIDILVNNAGFGRRCKFLDANITDQTNMIDLNINTLVKLCHVFGNEMVKRGKGRILNVASAAALSAGPYMSVYYATKAFVLSFSQGLHEEVKKHGVTVTAFCPGPTKSDFESTAQVDFKMVKTAKASRVAKAGYRATMKGKAVKYHSFATQFANFGSRFFSRRITRKVAKCVNGAPE